MMASNITRVSLLFRKIANTKTKQILGGVREASSDPYRVITKQGWRAWDGDFVPSGKTLSVHTRLKCAPGLNVTYRRGKLAAKVAGKVMITTEISNFEPEHGIVKLYFPDTPSIPIKYFHVIPEEQHCRFKLVDTN